MENKEFCLSEKMVFWSYKDGGDDFLWAEDVKEFIRRLKEDNFAEIVRQEKECKMCQKFKRVSCREHQALRLYFSGLELGTFKRIIDKLAGEKLI